MGLSLLLDPSGLDTRRCQGIVGMRGRGPGAENTLKSRLRGRLRDLSHERGGGERLGQGGDTSGRRLFRSSARRSS